LIIPRSEPVTQQAYYTVNLLPLIISRSEPVTQQAYYTVNLLR